MKRKPPRRSWFRRIFLWAFCGCALAYSACATGLLYVRWRPPPATAVQLQRRVEAWSTGKRYTPKTIYEPLGRISPELRHAVVAAEDTSFYSHNGIDWAEMEKVIEESRKKGRLTRGGSTITQQLVKNLFLTTHGSFLRKAAEYILAPTAEIILGKNRILELYLNVVEWGPGIYGAEAAAQYHYHHSAATLNLDEATRLAAILPAPRTRRPSRMNEYSAEIQDRMRRMGWLAAAEQPYQ